MSISTTREIGPQQGGLAVSLLFAAGTRPDAAAVHALAESGADFSISHYPGATAGAGDALPADWLELLMTGLTFDLVGLAPGVSADVPPGVHRYGMPPDNDALVMQAITLRPGPHLAGGHAMPPIVRAIARLAATLATLPRVTAVAWHPARNYCGAEHFHDAVMRWLDGGVFPALGLTSLAATPDGGMQSEGLSLFTGQELRLEPELLDDKAQGAKTGLRLIDRLVEIGRVEEPQRIVGPNGEPLRLEPSPNGRFVRVWRG